MTASEYERLVEIIEGRRRKRDESAGALKEAMKRLLKQFGCSTLEEAEVKLAELEQKEQKLLRKRDRARKAFDEKWQSVIEELP